MKKILYLLLIIILLLTVSITVIYAAYKTYKPHNIILMYHSIQPEPLNKYKDLYVSPDDLENQFKIINELGITTSFVNEINSGGIYITFDDGYEDNYTNAFPLIIKHNVKVTIFMIADFIGKKGYLTESQIKEMADSGLVSIQSHTATHPDLTLLDSEQLYYELYSSKQKLEDITGQIVDVISYPYGKYDSIVTDLASQIYSIGVTTKGPNRFNDTNDNLRLPRYGIPNTYDIAVFSNLIQY